MRRLFEVMQKYFFSLKFCLQIYLSISICEFCPQQFYCGDLMVIFYFSHPFYIYYLELYFKEIFGFVLTLLIQSFIYIIMDLWVFILFLSYNSTIISFVQTISALVIRNSFFLGWHLCSFDMLSFFLFIY